MNAVLIGVIESIYEATKVLESICPVGDLSICIKGDYKGEYAIMKDTLNETSNTLNRYVDEISYNLDEMSHENFDLTINTNYEGDFAPINGNNQYV